MKYRGWMVLLVAGACAGFSVVSGQETDAKAKVRQAQAVVDLRETEFKSFQLLYKRKAISAEELDLSQMKLEEARYQLAALEQKASPVLLEHLGNLATIQQARLKRAEQLE